MRTCGSSGANRSARLNQQSTVQREPRAECLFTEPSSIMALSARGMIRKCAQRVIDIQVREWSGSAHKSDLVYLRKVRDFDEILLFGRRGPIVVTDRNPPEISGHRT